MSGELNPVGLVAIDRDRFGRIVIRTQERTGDVRPVGGIDLEPDQGPGIVDLAPSTCQSSSSW